VVGGMVWHVTDGEECAGLANAEKDIILYINWTSRSHMKGRKQMIGQSISTCTCTFSASDSGILQYNCRILIMKTSCIDSL
jgi:hypothetical protein